MINSEIETILIKYLNKSANGEELDTLNEWIQTPANELIFKDYIKTHHAITISMNQPDSSDIRKRLLKEIREEKKIVPRVWLRTLVKYAALAILFLSVGYYFQKDVSVEIAGDRIVPKVEAITLELENGHVQVISEDGTSTVVDANGNVVGNQKGDKLIYSADTDVEKLTYNTLTIPYGKRFDITLSDGTTVFLNAGSSIKYPVKFIKGLDRHVYLNGEAFFDVTKDKSHPFIVDAQEINVEVLGTKFNVSSYRDDSEIDVVLVEGSVSLEKEKKMGSKDNTVILQPGFNGSFNKMENTISTGKVNTSLYTSWMTGIMVFRNTPFKEIVKKLERVYNVTITINNKELVNEHFNASIEVDKETIEEVLSYFNKLYEIEYKIVDNKVFIN